MFKLSKSLQLSRSRLHLFLFNESFSSTANNFNAEPNIAQATQQSELPKNVADLVKNNEKKLEKKIINPFSSEDFFQVRDLVKLEELFK